MGLKGYQKHLSNHSKFTEHLFERDPITYKTAYFSWLNKIKNKTLYVDGPSFHNWLYGTVHPRFVYPRYNAFVDQIIQFNTACVERHVKVIIVYDGIKRYDFNIWCARQKSCIKDLNKLVERGTTRNMKITGGGGLLEKYVKADIIKAHMDADSEIMKLATEDPNCGGIFSTDSDFAFVEGDFFWFTTDGEKGHVRSVYLPSLQGFGDQIVTSLMTAWGRHEQCPRQLSRLVHRVCESYDDVYEFADKLRGISSTDKQHLIDTPDGPIDLVELKQSLEEYVEDLFKPSQHQGMCTSDDTLIRYYEKNKLPWRIIDIILNGQDLDDCVWYQSDLDWTWEINRRLYAVFCDKEITYSCHVVESASLFQVTDKPDVDKCPFNGDYEQLLKATPRARQDYVNWVLQTNSSKFFETVWSTFSVKLQRQPESDMILKSLFITMLARFYNVRLPVPRRVQKIETSIYPSVHRWLKHIRFLR